MKNLFEILAKPDYLFDSHCHLNAKDYDHDRSEIVDLAIKSGIEKIFDISVDLNSSEKAVKNAKDYDHVLAVVGTDPEIFIPSSEMFIGFDIPDSWFEEYYEKLSTLIDSNREYIIGIGESGMDDYWTEDLNTADQAKSLEYQEKLFRLHLEIASEYNLPLSIHSRNIENKCLEIVKKYDAVGIFHSYTGNYETAKGILDSGWGLGVNGIFTFKNAQELRDIYLKILGSDFKINAPLDLYQKGIYLETDGPYLSPEGKRGERNEPVNIEIIYKKFLEIYS